MTGDVFPLRRVDEIALADWIIGQGFSVIEYDGGDNDPWGWTSPSLRTVALRADLAAFQRVPTLAHECLHVYNRHEGHQPQAVEDRINEIVANALVDPIDYAWAESQYGWSTGGIAHALEVPRWVIEAYRRTLKRQAGGLHPRSLGPSALRLA